MEEIRLTLVHALSQRDLVFVSDALPLLAGHGEGMGSKSLLCGWCGVRLVDSVRIVPRALVYRCPLCGSHGRVQQAANERDDHAFARLPAQLVPRDLPAAA